MAHTKQFSKFLSGFRIGWLHNAYLLQFRLLRSNRRRVLWTFFLFLARWKVISCAYKELPCIKLKNFLLHTKQFSKYFVHVYLFLGERLIRGYKELSFNRLENKDLVDKTALKFSFVWSIWSLNRFKIIQTVSNRKYYLLQDTDPRNAEKIIYWLW